jgi:hypothetical protein
MPSALGSRPSCAIIDVFLSKLEKESHHASEMPNANATTEPHVDAHTSTSTVALDARPPARIRAARSAAFVGAALVVGLLLGAGGIPCGFAHLTHVPCPGCGSTRAMLALATGDLHGLLRYNPFAPLMSVLVAALVGQALSSLVTTGTFGRVGTGAIGQLVSRGVVVVATLEVLLWLARFGGLFGGPVPV